MRPDNSPARPAAKSCANKVAAIVVVLAAAAIAASLLLSHHEAEGRLVAVVHASDGSATTLPLDTDAVTTVATADGANEVTVRDGSVFVSDADCDNQDCMHQGAISAPGQQIICLPHELWIEVLAEGDASGSMDVGAVAGAEKTLDAVSR